VDPARIASRSGLPFDALLDAGVLARALDEGYLAWAGGRLAATRDGRIRLDALLPALLA
jgi:oxygen-independent coproporphyrinogen-3 oxidase